MEKTEQIVDTKSNKRKSTTKHLIICGIFAALAAVCSQIQIPLPMVPINLALFAVHMSGALLGAKLGTISMLVYVLLGAVGAPVFSGFTGGFGTLAGPTGGYIIGYILCAFIVGIICDKWGRAIPKMALAMVLGVICCYTFGTAWFMIVMKMGLWESLLACVFPFLIGDAVKIVLAILLTNALRKPLSKAGWIIG